MADKNSQKVESMTSTQSAFAAAVMIGIFVIWSLWIPVGKPLICWLNANPNLAAWAQAIFGFGAIIVAIIIPYIQRKIDKKEEVDKKIKEAKFKFIEILSVCGGISERLMSYKSVIEKTGTLNSQAFLWGKRYMRVYDNVKMPNIYDVKDLDVIPGNISVRLVSIFQLFINIEDSLKFSLDTADESSDPVERDSLLFQTIELINGKLEFFNKELIELSQDFQKEYLMATG